MLDFRISSAGRTTPRPYRRDLLLGAAGSAPSEGAAATPGRAKRLLSAAPDHGSKLLPVPDRPQCYAAASRYGAFPDRRKSRRQGPAGFPAGRRPCGARRRKIGAASALREETSIEMNDRSAALDHSVVPKRVSFESTAIQTEKCQSASKFDPRIGVRP